MTVCGDIHGQFFDLLELFRIGGEIPFNKYIFIGDFVDRGYNSVETFEYLLCLKLRYPDKICLLRGNHESRNMTENFTFREEAISRYDMEIYNLFMEVFDSMPLSCIIDGKYFGMHGGISPELSKLD